MLGNGWKRRWQQLVAKEAREGVLSLPEERELVRLEATHRESAIEERVVWEQLGSLGRRKFAGEASDNDLIFAALDRLPEALPTPRLIDETSSEASPIPAANGRHRFTALIAVVALAIGASAMAALTSSRSNGSDTGLHEPSIALAPAAADDGASEPEPEPIIIADAELHETTSAKAGILAAGCTRIRSSTEVCVEGDATITSLQPLRVRLDAGRVSVRSSSPITVESPMGPIVTEAADFDLEVAPLPSTTNLSVTAGAVSVWREERLEEVEAGQIVQLRKRSLGTERRRSPQRALLLAQKLVQRGQIAEAILHYEAILKHHPRSVEARTARVTLGRLELGRARPGQALEHFEAYLGGRGGGALHEEARYGRIRALRALGREREERKAIARFLREHPQSIYASRLAERQATFAAIP